FVAGAGDGLQLGSRRDKRERSSHLVDRTEAIVRPVHEECGDLQTRQVRRTQLGRPLWRMERVGEQQQTVRHTGLSGGQHGCLPSSIGMTAKEQTPRVLSPHAGGGCSQSLLVTFSAAARWRPVRPKLAKGQVAAEHSKSRTAK